jgi:hypothetical protein
MPSRTQDFCSACGKKLKKREARKYDPRARGGLVVVYHVRCYPRWLDRLR